MRTRGSSKLTPAKRKELILTLCQSLCTLKNSQEVADALSDLLTPKEMETIAKRLQIAEYLVKGDDYSTIRNDLKVGYSTIARINTWLNLSGEGFKIMFKRRAKAPAEISDEERYDPYSWHNIKRRYSLYFWPQLLLEELIKTSDKKQKQKINEAFEKLELKGRRFNSKNNRDLFESFTSDFLPRKIQPSKKIGKNIK